MVVRINSFITIRLKGQKKLAFAPLSLIIANNFLPLNEALGLARGLDG